MKTLVKASLDMARSQDGVREVGNNAGKKVTEYLRSTGLGPGYPWCAAFVHWCIQQAADKQGCDNPFICTAGCAVIHSWARQHDLVENRPAAGDVFLLFGVPHGESRRRACHTGFVTKADGPRFDTIEGNTNLSGGREGIGVFQRQRTNSDRYCFVRWERLVEAKSDATMRLFLSGKSILDMPLRGGVSLCPIRDWAKCLGFEFELNEENQTALFDGKELQTELVLLDGGLYAPIRDLADFSGLQVKPHMKEREVHVSRFDP